MTIQTCVLFFFLFATFESTGQQQQSENYTIMNSDILKISVFGLCFCNCEHLEFYDVWKCEHLLKQTNET